MLIKALALGKYFIKDSNVKLENKFKSLDDKHNSKEQRLLSKVNLLKEKLGNIIIGYNSKREPIYAKNLNAQGAMAVLLKDAIKPNLVQTLEHTPPWYLMALIVATKTTASGFNPDFLHFISKNFSAPKSAPNPASVIT